MQAGEVVEEKSLSRKKQEISAKRYIDVLDESGLRTGRVLSKEDIHKQGVLHRAIHLYLFDAAGRILLQKRAATVDHYPGYWSISLTGHIEAGEGAREALFRELKEELGLDTQDVTVEHLFSYRREARLSSTYIDRQINEVFVGFCKKENPPIKHDPKEVSEVKFISFAAFLALTQDPKSQLAPVYQEAAQEVGCFLKNRLKA